MAVAKGKKNQKIEKAEADQVLSTVASYEAPTVVKSVAELQLEVQEVLSGLTGKVTEKFAVVENLDTAISLKEQRLKDLHGIEAAAITLDDLKAQQEQQKSQFEAEIASVSAKWAQDADDRRLNWEREEQAHKYNTELARKRSNDEWDALLAKRQRDEQVRAEQLTKSWDERSTKLAAAEKELADARTRIANLQTEIDAAVKKEVAIATNSLKRDHEQQLRIVEINAANDKKLAEANIASLNSQIQQLQAANAALQAEVKAANQRAETIAAKAVEASSGRQALEAVQRQTETLGQNAGKGR